MVEAEVQAVAGPSFDSSRFELLSQGAEARVWTGTFLQRPVVVKQRFPKAYRHPALDAKLTQQRLKAEVRGLLKARKLGVSTPVLFHVDTATACIYMERLEGSSVKHILHSQSMDDAARNTQHSHECAAARHRPDRGQAARCGAGARRPDHEQHGGQDCG
ncbi:CGL126 [Auxenochlorella protothecoides x Auxenochlorella symbiontica]